MSSRGFFVTVEGPEASGKSTALAHVARRLAQLGCEPLMTREPGGTDIGLQIRSILLDTPSGQLGSKSEFLLFQADRAEHVRTVIEPALQAGRVVLCDRFILSTIAYQIGGRKLPREESLDVIKFATGGLIPDLTIMLTVDLDVSMRRMQSRGGANRLDNESRQFHSAIHAAYDAHYGGSFARSWMRINTTPAHMTEEMVSRLMSDAIMRAYRIGSSSIVRDPHR